MITMFLQPMMRGRIRYRRVPRTTGIAEFAAVQKSGKRRTLSACGP